MQYASTEQVSLIMDSVQQTISALIKKGDTDLMLAFQDAIQSWLANDSVFPRLLDHPDLYAALDALNTLEVRYCILS